MSRIYYNNVLFINGRPAAHAGPGGEAHAPEECWVNVAGQKVKQQFTNSAYAKDLKGTASKMFYKGHPLATLKSFTKTSYGDEDTEGGVKSGTKQGRLRFLTASPNVYSEGVPLCFHGNEVILNDENSEPSTWDQPSSSGSAIQELYSDPLQDLPDEKSLNIELIRSVEYQFAPVMIQQVLKVQHTETGDTRYRNFGMFKPNSDQFILHDPSFAEGQYQVYEVFEKSVEGLIEVPLGLISADAPKSHEPGLKLVPLTFKQYADLQNSQEAAQALFPNSYIYIFKDGYLWREFEVSSLGSLCEVDLAQFYLNPVRLAKAEVKQGILIPLEDAEGRHEFKIAVSHISWSWDFIYKLGGVDPKDPRFKSSYRFLFEPDQALIKQRLKPLMIHRLINHGVQCQAIPREQSESALLEDNQACLPPDSNLYWIAAEEKLNLSKGMTKVLDDLAWVSPSLVTDPHSDLYSLKPVPGSAVYHFYDALGCLHYLAESMNIQAKKYQDFLKEHGQPYTLALMVGHMKEALDEGDYMEVTREGARLRHIKLFEDRRDAHTAYLSLAGKKLNQLFEDSHAQGQWLDFDGVPAHLFDQSMIKRQYSDLIGDVFTAMQLSSEGHEFLKAEVTKADSKILHEANRDAIWTHSQMSLKSISDMGAVLAASLKPDAESLIKIVNFLEKALGEKIEAKIVEVPLQEIVEWHTSTTVVESEYSAVYELKNNRVSVQTAKTVTATQVKTKVVFIRDIPMYQIQTVLNKGSPVVLDLSKKGLEKLKSVSEFADKNAKFRVVIGALSVVNIYLQHSQMKDLDAQGDLTGTEGLTYRIEIFKSILLITELAFKQEVETTRILMSGRRSLSSAVSKKAGVLGAIAGVGLDAIYMYKYTRSGEYSLIFAHSVGLFGGLLTIYGSSLISMGLVFGVFTVAGIILGVISAALIYYFAKSTYEQWIFDGYWGRTQGTKDSIYHSIEKLHLNVTLVDFMGIERQFDERTLARIKSPREQIILAYITPKDLVFHFKTPFRDGYIIKHKFISYHRAGTFQVEERRLKLLTTDVTENEVRWAVLIPQLYFEESGLMGKIQIECYEESTQALIGVDAYEFSKPIHEYTFRKVLHAPPTT